MLEIIVDSRETKLLELLGDSVSSDYLDNGDILIRDAQWELLIERKTWCDLKASIQDGRYREQRARLLQRKEEKETTVIMYLIEGNGIHMLDESSYETCRRTLHRLMIAYLIPVYFTQTVEQTSEWIQWIQSQNTLETFFKKRDAQQDRVEAMQCRFDKKSIQTPKNLLLHFLLTIHGVSYNMACAIASPYDSISDFLSRKEEIASVLTNVEYVVEKTQKKRKIGPKLISKILQLLG